MFSTVPQDKQRYLALPLETISFFLLTVFIQAHTTAKITEFTKGLPYHAWEPKVKGLPPLFMLAKIANKKYYGFYPVYGG
jgi:hypothetical protein